MRYRFVALLALLLGGTTAQAQLITDPTRAAAARDTLLREAQRLRILATQSTPVIVTNANSRSRNRVRVTGTFVPTPVVMVPSVVGQRVPSSIAWKHVTRYHYNGRVQEKFRIKLDGRLLLKEGRLDGAVRWLLLPLPFGVVMGQPVRHRGLYLQTGYVFCDDAAYVLPPPAR